MRTLPYLENGKPILDQLDERRTGAIARRHARPQGARQDAGRTGRWRVVPVCRSVRSLSTTRRRPCFGRPQQGHAEGRAARRCRRVGDWMPPIAEAAIREFAERQQPQARRGRAAVARRVDGKADVARRFRRAGGAGRDESLARIGDQNRLGQPGCPTELLKSRLLRCNITTSVKLGSHSANVR